MSEVVIQSINKDSIWRVWNEVWLHLFAITVRYTIGHLESPWQVDSTQTTSVHLGSRIVKLTIVPRMLNSRTSDYYVELRLNKRAQDRVKFHFVQGASDTWERIIRYALNRDISSRSECLIIKYARYDAWKHRLVPVRGWKINASPFRDISPLFAATRVHL